MNIFFRLFVNRVGMDDDGPGCGRAGQLAGAAADAVLLVNFRIKDVFPVCKTDGVRGADFTARAAILMIDENNTNIF